MVHSLESIRNRFGLGIVRRLVALMGGSISLESAEGEGTTIAFTIAVQPGASKLAAISPQEKEEKQCDCPSS